MNNSKNKHIRKIIDASRQRAKNSSISPCIRTLTTTDRILLFGIPATCAAILICEKDVDLALIVLLAFADLIFYMLLREFGLLDRIIYFLLNVLIITSGNKVKDILLVEQNFTTEEIIFVCSMDLFIVLAAWTTLSKRCDSLTFWDLTLTIIVVVNVSLAMYFGRLEYKDVLNSIAVIRKLLPL